MNQRSELRALLVAVAAVLAFSGIDRVTTIAGPGSSRSVSRHQLVEAFTEAAKDDDTGGGDYIEAPNCGGFDLPECGTPVDVPPDLQSVAVRVNGKVVAMPTTLAPDASLELALEFLCPMGYPCVRHVFIVKDGEAYCVGDGGVLDSEHAMDIADLCSTEALGKPYAFPVDPTIFLDGKGAPYGVEIMNECGTHSNRLPLDIITKSGDEGDGGESEGCGCGG